MVTAGANQAFSLLALALCDPGDTAVLLAPYYFSHLVALQIAQAKVVEGKWDPTTLLPDVDVGREGGKDGGKGGRRSGRVILTVERIKKARRKESKGHKLDFMLTQFHKKSDTKYNSTYEASSPQARSRSLSLPPPETPPVPSAPSPSSNRSPPFVMQRGRGW